MITTPEDYLSELWRLNNGNIKKQAIRLPKEEAIYEIDLDKRTIKAPPFLSVETDHAAETIYFVCDRYHDNMDLANTVCVVKYINALGEGYMYGVPFLDVTTFSGEGDERKYIKAYVIPSNYERDKYYIKENDTYILATGAYDSKAEYYSYVDQPKILFPWMIEGGATKETGVVQYSVEFYMLEMAENPEDDKIIYSLNTKPTQSKVLEGLDIGEFADDNAEKDPITLQSILGRLNKLETDWDIYWYEA